MADDGSIEDIYICVVVSLCTSEFVKRWFRHVIVSPMACFIDIFCILLEVSGNIIHKVDFAGRTALHYACQFHSPKIVSLLLSQGAQTDILVCDISRSTYALSLCNKIPRFRTSSNMVDGA
jgi:hypothetical protein